MGAQTEEQPLEVLNRYADPTGNPIHDIFWRGMSELLDSDLREIHPIEALRNSVPIVRVSRQVADTAVSAVTSMVHRVHS